MEKKKSSGELREVDAGLVGGQMGGHWAAYKTNSNNLWMLFDDTGVDVDDLCRTLCAKYHLTG